MTKITKNLEFSVLIEKVEGAFVAHCLETGLVATGLDQDDALSKMSKLLIRQVTFALENGNLRAAFNSAPKEIWDKWINEERIIGRSRTPIPSRVGSGFEPLLTIGQTAYAQAIC